MILGKRIRDEESKLELHLRAAALSGKLGPLLFLAEYEYSRMYITNVRALFLIDHYFVPFTNHVRIGIMNKNATNPRASFLKPPDTNRNGFKSGRMTARITAPGRENIGFRIVSSHTVPRQRADFDF